MVWFGFALLSPCAESQPSLGIAVILPFASGCLLTALCSPLSHPSSRGCDHNASSKLRSWPKRYFLLLFSASSCFSCKSSFPSLLSSSSKTKKKKKKKNKKRGKKSLGLFQQLTSSLSPQPEMMGSPHLMVGPDTRPSL